jgi:hypothetical protein
VPHRRPACNHHYCITAVGAGAVRGMGGQHTGEQLDQLCNRYMRRPLHMNTRSIRTHGVATCPQHKILTGQWQQSSGKECQLATTLTTAAEKLLLLHPRGKRSVPYPSGLPGQGTLLQQHNETQTAHLRAAEHQLLAATPCQSPKLKYSTANHPATCSAPNP